VNNEANITAGDSVHSKGLLLSAIMNPRFTTESAGEKEETRPDTFTGKAEAGARKAKT